MHTNERRALDALLADCDRHPMISDAEVNRLAQHPRQRDAVNRIVTANMRLVIHMAHSFSKRPGELLDLVQAGAVGMHRAAEKYDPNRGVKFVTYAGWWIRAEMRMLKKRTFSIVNLAGTRAGRDHFFKLEAMIQRAAALGESLTSEELAARTKSTTGHVDRLRIAMMGDVHLDAAYRDSQTTFGDMLTSEPNPEDVYLDELRRKDLRELMAVYRARLPRKLEREVFDGRIANDTETLADIGKRMGVCRERVRQIEQRLREQLVAMAQNYYDPDDSVGAA